MNEITRQLKAAARKQKLRLRFDAGRSAGALWAQHQAEDEQLASLAENYDPHVGLRDQPGDAGLAGVVYWLINGDFEAWSEVDEFWGEALCWDEREDIEDPLFAEGFITGALDVWERVEAQS